MSRSHILQRLRATLIASTALAVLLVRAFVGEAQLPVPDSAPAGERRAVIAAGQDSLLGDILGQGESLGGCSFLGGAVDASIVHVTYACAAGEVKLDLIHPDAAPPTATRTERFAIMRRGGSPPETLLAALTDRIRAREAAFQWTLIVPPREEPRRAIALPVALVALAVVAAWLLRSWVAKMLLVAGGVVAGIVLLELLIRVPGLETLIISRALYLQAADIGVHRVSRDPFLHYELAPGAEATVVNSYHVSIDAFGARQPTHAKVKASGTIRILAFGGSTMYGASVHDEQTIAAALEAHLNRAPATDSSRHYEVWNFGTSAYTLGQACHLAQAKLAELDPDIIIVQHHNIGRRPFLATSDNRIAGEPPELDQRDVGFYLEQFTVPKSVSAAVHRHGLEYSALYRSLTALNTFRGYKDWECTRCNEISMEQASELSRAAEARKVPVFYVMIPTDRGRFKESDIFPALPADRFIDLFKEDREVAFYEVHPPPPILAEYAIMLADALRARGALPR